MKPTRRGFLKGVAAIAAGLYLGVGSALRPIYAPEAEEKPKRGFCFVWADAPRHGNGTLDAPFASIDDALEMARDCEDEFFEIRVLSGHYERRSAPIEVPCRDNLTIAGWGGPDSRPVFDFGGMDGLVEELGG